MTSQSVVDQKIQVLYEKYRDHDFVATAMKEVEDIRRSALMTGGAISAAVFVANEAVRLTMRSRKIFITLFITILCSIVQVEVAQHCILVGCSNSCC